MKQLYCLRCGKIILFVGLRHIFEPQRKRPCVKDCIMQQDDKKFAAIIILEEDETSQEASKSSLQGAAAKKIM
jgi:hypothetical protein